MANKIKNYGITRVVTHRFQATSWNAALSYVANLNLIEEAECEDTLFCEETGQEELL